MDTLATPQRTSDVASFSKGYQRWLLFVLMPRLHDQLRRSLSRRRWPRAASPRIRDHRLSARPVAGAEFRAAVLDPRHSVRTPAERRNRVRSSRQRRSSGRSRLRCGAAASYVQLLLVRVGVGVGEAGFMAPASSILGDHFTRERRAFATSMMMLGVPVGALIGASTVESSRSRWGGAGRSSSWASRVSSSPCSCGSRCASRRAGTSKASKSWTCRPPDVARQCFVEPVFRHVVIGGVLGGFGCTGSASFWVYFTRMSRAAVQHLRDALRARCVRKRWWRSSHRRFLGRPHGPHAPQVEFVDSGNRDVSFRAAVSARLELRSAADRIRAAGCGGSESGACTTGPACADDSECRHVPHARFHDCALSAHRWCGVAGLGTPLIGLPAISSPGSWRRIWALERQPRVAATR